MKTLKYMVCIRGRRRAATNNRRGNPISPTTSNPPSTIIHMRFKRPSKVTNSDSSTRTPKNSSNYPLIWGFKKSYTRKKWWGSRSEPADHKIMNFTVRRGASWRSGKGLYRDMCSCGGFTRTTSRWLR